MAADLLAVKELKEACFFLKSDINSGCIDINFYIAKHCFDVLNEPLKDIFEVSLKIYV